MEEIEELQVDLLKILEGLLGHNPHSGNDFQPFPSMKWTMKLTNVFV